MLVAGSDQGRLGDEGYVVPGVWGWVGSGILFVAPDDSFLLALRSDEVVPPSVWGIPGGQVPKHMREDLEGIRASAEDEIEEELGAMPPLYEYTNTLVLYPDDFPQQLRLKREQFAEEDRYPQFYVFRYDVPMEVKHYWEPDLEFSSGAWENDDYAWMTFEDLAEMEEGELLPGLVKEIMKLVPR